MPDLVDRFHWVGKLALAVLIGTLGVLALVMIVTVAAGVQLAANTGFWAKALGVSEPMTGALQWLGPIACAIFLLIELAVAGWAMVGYGLLRLLCSIEGTSTALANRMAPVETLLEDQGASLKKLTELAGLSDQAKSLLYRDREIEAIRETIQDDIIKRDYASAETLIQNVEKRLGYTDEAARLRQEVEAGKKASRDEIIDDAVARLQDIISHHDWGRAARAAQRMVKLFPNSPKAAEMPQRIEAAKTEHKRSLLQAYGEAVRKNDVDQSIVLLKELDRYLTPQEAAALAESARGVFRAKLHNLGVQFAISVTDQQWAAAVATGQEIIAEFPNTRMAHEVREKMELLRTRAGAAKA